MGEGNRPTGEERSVKPYARQMINGAPIAYILTLAAVVAALAFIPLSIVVGTGKGFPMGQGIYPLIGWLLGPWAGALSSGVGAAIGTLVAPQTASPVSILNAVTSSFTAASMVEKGPRRYWWIPLALFFTGALGFYGYRAIVVNGVSVANFLAATFICWSALILYILPTRRLVGRWIKSQNPGSLIAGLFLGTWMGAGLAHIVSSSIMYVILNYPNDYWPIIAIAAPPEQLVRAVVGTIIGTGVITGIRAIGLIRPTQALY